MADDLDTWEGLARVRQDCEQIAAAEGLADLPLFFRSQRLFMERLNARPSYSERSRAFSARATKATNPLVDALRAIADGHNDPRRLARETLDRMEG